MHRVLIVSILLLLSPAGSAAWAQQNQPVWEIATGVDYSVGEYGAASDTTVFVFPLNLKLQADRLRGELTLSYLSLEGPGAFAGGPGTPVVVEPGTGGTSSRSGFGDVVAGAALAVYRSADMRSAIEIGGSVKFPTAETGLGTGKTDFTALVNFYHPLGTQLILSGAAGYQWLGDFQNFQLKDGVLGNIGLNLWPTQTTAIGGTLNYRQEPWAGIGEQVSIAPYLLQRFGDNWGFTVYGTVGLTEAAPRLGAGLRLTAYR